MHKKNSKNRLAEILGIPVRVKFIDTDRKWPGKRTFRVSSVFEGGVDFVDQYLYIRVYGSDKMEIIRALEQIFPDLKEEAIVYIERAIQEGSI